MRISRPPQLPRWLIALALALICATRAVAAPQLPTPPSADTARTEPSQRRLVVGIKPAPPFVIKEGDQYRGLAADVWAETANENGWSYDYREYDLQGLLDAVASGEVDIGIGAITTTAAREQRMDFSHPLTSSGLGIAVQAESRAGWLAVLRAFFSLAFLKVIALLAAVLLGVGWLVWLLEHKHNPEQFGDGDSRRGIFAGFWWAMVTMTTVGYGDVAPRTVGGRLLAMAWMLTALIIVSFFTATITSALTVGHLTGRISTADDLRGARIASITGSTSAHWLGEAGIKFNDAGNLDAALKRLAAGEVDAVVYDAPLLRWKIGQGYRNSLQVLPIRLERQDYAFAIPENSPLREPMNSALLERITAPDWKEKIEDYLGED